MSLDASLGNALDNRVKTEMDCGVVTAADSPFFPGVQLLYSSIVKTHSTLRLACFDIGLNEKQLAWASQQPRLDIISLTDEELLVGKDKQYWENLNRPFFLSHSPFVRTLWLDADCVVLKSLRPIFDHAVYQPFMIRDNVIHQIDSRLYDHIQIPGRDESFEVCSGIFGYSRSEQVGSQLVDCWESSTAEVLNHDLPLRQLLPLSDQSLLKIAIQKMDLTRNPGPLGPIIWPDMRWLCNVYARRSSVEEVLDTIADGFYILDHILHFGQLPKPWQVHGNQTLLDINPHKQS